MKNQPNLALLREARGIIAALPDEQINLARLVTHRDDDHENCGTIACAAGWLAMTPRFQALGLGLTETGWSLTINGEWDAHGGAYSNQLAQIFNMPAEDTCWLFDSRTIAEKNNLDLKKISDRELWLHRVDGYLERMGAA